MTGKRVNVTTDYREKQLQRALLQFSKPENANLVREALRLAGREDLIGFGKECLVAPAFGKDGKNGPARLKGAKGAVPARKRPTAPKFKKNEAKQQKSEKNRRTGVKKTQKRPAHK